MSNEHVDVADAVVNHPFSGTVKQNNLGAHGKDVLVTRRHLLVNQSPKSESKLLYCGVVTSEKLEQLRRWVGRGSHVDWMFDQR